MFHLFENRNSAFSHLFENRYLRCYFYYKCYYTLSNQDFKYFKQSWHLKEKAFYLLENRNSAFSHLFENRYLRCYFYYKCYYTLSNQDFKYFKQSWHLKEKVFHPFENRNSAFFPSFWKSIFTLLLLGYYKCYYTFSNQDFKYFKQSWHLKEKVFHLLENRNSVFFPSFWKSIFTQLLLLKMLLYVF